jgi:hypothetical protein
LLSLFLSWHLTEWASLGPKIRVLLDWLPSALLVKGFRAHLMSDSSRWRFFVLDLNSALAGWGGGTVKFFGSGRPAVVSFPVTARMNLFSKMSEVDLQSRSSVARLYLKDIGFIFSVWKVIFTMSWLSL